MAIIVRLLSTVFYDYRDRMDKSIKFCMDMLQDILINIRRGATQNFFPLAKKTKWPYFYTFIELKFLFYANFSMEKHGKHKSMCSE